MLLKAFPRLADSFVFFYFVQEIEHSGGGRE